MNIRKTLLGVGAVAGVGYLVYTYGLSENAQKSLRDAAHATYTAIRRLDELISQSSEPVKDAAAASAQRRETREQWEALGY